MHLADDVGPYDAGDVVFGDTDDTARAEAEVAEDLVHLFQGEEDSASDEHDASKDASWVALNLTRHMAFGEISEKSMEGLCKFFLDNIDTIRSIKRRGEISSSYRGSIKKRLAIRQPKILCAVKFIDLNGDVESPQELRDLPAIPKKYISPTLDNHYVCLRTEAYTSLDEIMKHYEETHPWKSSRALEYCYKNAAVGLDGVKQGNKGCRSLLVVSIMLGGCVYLWRVLNPMKNTPGAKADAEELLRPLVDELNNTLAVELKVVCADMLERHACRCMVSHSGFASCEFCRATGRGPNKGVDFEVTRSIGADKRTHRRWVRIARCVLRVIYVCYMLGIYMFIYYFLHVHTGKSEMKSRYEIGLA